MLISGIVSSKIHVLSYHGEVLADSPVGYWRLDETSGTNAVDEINGNDGTYTGGFTLNQAALINTGSCIDLDGATGSQVTIGSAAELEILGDMTIEAWCNLDSLANNSYLCTWWGTGETEANNFIWSLRVDNTSGLMACFWENSAGSNNTVISTHVVSTGEDHHLVCVRDTTAKTVTFYDNGVEYDTVAYTNNPTGGSTGGAYLGRNPNDAFSVNGRLDEVAIYNTKLSTARILAHYNSGI